MNETPKPHKDPLHGVSLEKILVFLVEKLGFAQMAEVVPVRCFEMNPCIKSSLTFLRKTPWARKKVEDLYVKTLRRFPNGQ
jgi:uncharacterized protein (DUF2132 family)